ncbi:asparagine synthase (glutamine-hydrolyzing) [Roseisolibacter sp. H3M3-2]|uniref:asparagine synthase (glutamine-hydrolyzing) n=1 Tax=Roseisolibacter sp. H3M3-2 TaxID=3031323 RepID=UPI0023DB7F47|nr:asparagine synthase (glutamine-hydrolyzing) [Roseisolibacter sp. H3M3-2]MDF1505351.1 asparagine synthase (glutamine-hydrolyzing) [Roseisolibacter sp. H3M3-2]
MCGIAGSIALDPSARVDEARVRAMSRCIAHRGPDGEGVWVAPSGRACLAHRRLSVIDLATGQQPFVDAGGATGLVFNGEIYNYRELRRGLEAGGERFRTQSDTEVLAKLLARDGLAAADVLRGMFSFAAWDDRTGRLLVGRDRVGKKPFHYAIEDGCLHFASSLDALRRTATRKWTLDPRAVDLYLSLGYIPAPYTIWREARKLPAATVGTLRDGALELREFWDLSRAPAQFEGSFDDAVARVDEVLGEATELRLRSDVPLGVFLSGGIDSSLIAALAAKRSADRLRTFSIGFDDAGEHDESAHARRIAEHLGTEHHEIRVRPDLLGILPRAIAHFGEPFADPSALPLWVLAEQARPHVTVALGGDGGDEGFGGYRWYRTARTLRRISRRVPASVASAAAHVLGHPANRLLATPTRIRLGRAERGLRMLSIGDPGRRFAALRNFASPRDADDLYAGELAALRGDPLGAAARSLVDAYDRAGGDALRRMRYVDVVSYLAEDLNPKVDVATMAHGVEARAPLLDQEVLELAFSLPEHYLVGPDAGKLPLRALLRRYVPPALFERPKQGFSVPIDGWFRGPLRERVSALPRSEPLLATGWLRGAGIARWLDEHQSGARDHSQRLFSLLVLEEWLAQQS